MTLFHLKYLFTEWSNELLCHKDTSQDLEASIREIWTNERPVSERSGPMREFHSELSIFTWRAFLVLMPATVRTWLDNWEAAPWEREARRMMTTETIRWWRNSDTRRLSDTATWSWASVVELALPVPGNWSVWSDWRPATTTWIPRAPPKPRKSASNLDSGHVNCQHGKWGKYSDLTVGN